MDAYSGKGLSLEAAIANLCVGNFISSKGQHLALVSIVVEVD